MSWMNGLADETFARAMRQTIKTLRNELRKNKIRRIFDIEV
jgi:hypothetical protein